MQVSCGTSFLRILLFVFNLAVLLAGAMMTGLGAYLVVEAKTYGMTGATFAIPVAMLALGILVLLTSFAGCYGTWKMKKGLLKLFAFLVFLMIVAEIICGVLLIVKRNEFRPFIQRYLEEAIKDINANANSPYKNIIYNIQDEMECCGAKGPKDWPQPNKSCCEDGHAWCFSYPYRGCVDALFYEMKEYIVGFGAVVIVLAVIEFGAIIVAMSLSKQAETY